MPLDRKAPRGSAEDPRDRLFLEVLARLREDGAEETEAAARRTGEGRTTDPGPRRQTAAARLLDLLEERGTPPGRYELLGVIGSGGMGEVLEVWDSELNRTLAMKVAQVDALAGPGARALRHRFVEEAQIASQLDHPGIVPVHELGVDERGRVFFTMRRVRGHDLAHVLAEEEGRDRTLPRLLDVLLKVCEAVGYAHSRGVLHRDLKPANVMVGRFGEVYVMDWGVARAIGSVCEAPAHDETSSTVSVRTSRREERREASDSPWLTRVGDVLGTPAYMSPEQARGLHEELDARSDVYSLGAILYHLLAGHAPYAEAGSRAPIAILHRALEGPPQPLSKAAPDAPPELVAICEKAMARDPDRRYAGASQLAEDLRAFLEGRVVAAYRTGALVELRKWVGRNRAVAGVSAGLVLALLVGGAVISMLFLQAREDERELREALVSVYRTRLQELVEQAGALFPIAPALQDDFASWLQQSERLARGVTQLRAELERDSPGSAALGELEALEQELRTLTDPSTGLISGRAGPFGPGVERRAELARRAHTLTQTPEVRALWGATLASIADPASSPAYEGLSLAPIPSLVPLGRDPRSGLYEFAHVLTGDPPAREVPSGRLVVREETALVLVLVPGGRTTIGAQRSDPAGPNHDPHLDESGERNEGPPVELTLRPYLIAKHEMTQGQWLRLTGENPSRYAPASEPVGGTSFDLRHPVERVTWQAATETLGWIGLVLPTEAQWEHAARGGSATPWCTGTEVATLAGAANLFDRSAVAAGFGAEWRTDDPVSFDDGFPLHAPADALAPNGFGLHHVMGNVYEWCRDPYVGGYADARFDPDGLRLGRDIGSTRPLRGGVLTRAAGACRMSRRTGGPPDIQEFTVGLRPAMLLEGT